MQRFIYPAVFYKDEDIYRVIFPDIELETDGKIMEEAFLYAKEFLKSYFVFAIKHDLDYNFPSDFETVHKSAGKDSTVMLIDAIVSDVDLK